MKKLLLIAPSELPIPAVKGGAVETGIQQIIDENEKNNNASIDVYSYYDQKAYEQSRYYKRTRFKYYVPKPREGAVGMVLKVLNAIFRKTGIKICLDVRPSFTKYICENIKKNNYDAILVKNATQYIIPISKICKSRLYLQLHNDFLNSDTPKAATIANKCTKIIANSSYIKNRILTVPRLSKKKVLVNMNCLDDDSFRAATKQEKRSIIEKYNIDNESKIILFSGRLVKEKGIDKLVEAIKKLDKDRKWVLLIAGAKWFSSDKKDKYSQMLLRQIKGLENRIIFLGYVPHSEISLFNSIADVVVIPSIWEEPAGRVALEAAAVGTPVITTDAGGLKEYINTSSSIVLNRGQSFTDELSKAIEEVIFYDKFHNRKNESIKFAKQFNSKRYYNEIIKYMNLS